MKVIFASILLLLWAAPKTVFASGEPRLATKLGRDSTTFRMSLMPKQYPKVGKTFKVKIHVTPHGDWHVYSAKMRSEEGLTPLTLQVPPKLEDYLSIEKIEETGKLRTSYDSNFMTVTMAHYTPYDIIVTMKVKKKADSELPFFLYLHFQTCNETMCMPPRTFAVPMTVLGEQPIKLKIAEARIAGAKNYGAATRVR